MAEINFNARIRHKRDTEQNWTAKNPILLDGEIVIVDTNDGVRKKVGSGKRFNDTPYEDKVILEKIDSKSDASISVSLMLQSNKWVDSRQTLIVENITKDTNGIIGLPYGISVEELEEAKSAELYISAQSNNEVVITAYGPVPKRNIPVVLILMG